MEIISTLILLLRMSDIHVNVYLCNVVRTVVEGKALVSPILETLKTADSYILTFLIDVRKICLYLLIYLIINTDLSSIRNFMAILNQHLNFRLPPDDWLHQNGHENSELRKGQCE